MIQRIQTVWLLVAVILGVVVLVSKLGTFLSTGMAPDATLYNLFLLQNGQHNFSVAALFGIMLLASTVGLFAVFMFKNRKMQMRLCSTSILLCLLWYAALVEVWMRFVGDEAFTFEPSWFILALPCVMAVFFFLAYKGVKHDDELVRSADRIR